MKKTQNLVSENEFGESLCHLIYLAQSGEEAKSIDLSAELQKQYGNALASAPEVGEAVAWFAKRRNEHSGFPFPAVWMPITKEQYESDEFNIPQLELKVHYSTPQTDRTAQLERQLAERGEEIERLQSYEQGLNGVIAWMKERGLYHDADYFGEGADFAAILTEHEQQVSACTKRQLEADKARMLDALRKAAETTYSDKLHVDWIALIADMEAKG